MISLTTMITKSTTSKATHLKTTKQIKGNRVGEWVDGLIGWVGRV